MQTSMVADQLKDTTSNPCKWSQNQVVKQALLGIICKVDKSEGQETFTKFHSLSLSKGTILTEETNLRAKKIFLEVNGIYEGPDKLAVSCMLGMLEPIAVTAVIDTIECSRRSYLMYKRNNPLVFADSFLRCTPCQNTKCFKFGLRSLLYKI